ncbi:amidohydrolase family protein [Synoicihabitans lomoniglobus]|uniref:Amidohydrolase family protein n=1 Tax=Synoicihabitans lomoniglobus TaxID=2909285 RepID=A0AAF0CRB4_9BACT|nr:amidohydrolase family protein [Opitutaceae bacterium LMO-M01]WED66626.1 amidohydrolase family protein [Opitutaceae bacterium LMO-M01]
MSSLSLRRCLLRVLPILALSSVLSSPAAATLLVKNAQLITVDPVQPVTMSGWFLVGDDGRIAALAAGQPGDEVSADEVLDAAGRIVAPGFISAHSHLYMSPVRGVGFDSTLYGWGRALGPILRRTTGDDIYWFTLHGSLDFLRNGITTAYDFTNSGVNYTPAVGLNEKVPYGVPREGPFEENQIRAKADAGLRFVNSVGLPRVGAPAETRARYENVLTFFNAFARDEPLALKMAISGGVQRAPDIGAAHLEAALMHDHGLINQSHFLESPERVAEQQAKFAWYEEAGALGPQMIFGHFIQVTDAIVAKVAATDSRMCWQPTSNGRLASGIPDVTAYRAAGIKVGIGLDDQSCTDISDPFQNMRIGMYTMRALHSDAAAMPVGDMLFLHTLGSAQILDIDADVGSLEVGKFADFLVVDPRAPDTGPIHNLLATYVLACGLRNLDLVYVGGRRVAAGTTMLSYDESIVRHEVDTRMARIKADIAVSER